MDMQEASAMTEASGLATDERGAEGSSRSGTMLMGARRPAERLSDQLRELTMAAPLPALFVAFALGVLVARRR